MKFLYSSKLGLFMAVFFVLAIYSPVSTAYPVAKIKNNTEYTVKGKVVYPGCRDDKYTVRPGKTWKAPTRRGSCLISRITGKLSGTPASLRGTGKSSFGERKEVTKYKSSGTSYSQFQINAFGDRYRIFSKQEYKKVSKTGRGSSPGFRFVNHTAWPVALSFDQVGCLYYGIVPAKFRGRPGEFRRDTGAVWFTIRAHIQPDGINPQTDWDCIRPVAELVGEVALAAMSGGSSVAASGGRIAAKQIAKAAIKKAARKAVKKIRKFGKKQLGEYLTQTSSIVMPGQYAGYEWPFHCNNMPEYHIRGGPAALRDESGEFYLEEGQPLTVKKVNTCGNDMMLASVKSKTGKNVDVSRFFKTVAEKITVQPNGPRVKPIKPTIHPPTPRPRVNPAKPTVQSAGQRIQSFNFKNRYIRHQNFNGMITPVKNRLDKLDASFKIVRGLAGGRGTISFESVNYPGYYLRHQNYQLKLHRGNNSARFNENATFIKRAGLASRGWLSFESVDFPGYFIRHQNFRLKIMRGSGNVFRKDATFRLISQ